jgi:hypothetical protein
MRYYLKSQKGAALLLELVLLAVVLSAAGLALYHAYSLKHASNKASVPVPHKANPSPTQTAKAATDQELIVAVLKARYTSPSGSTPIPGSKFTLCKLEGDYAIVGESAASGAGGGEVWLKKSQGTWSIAREGQNYDPVTQASSLDFPQGFGNSCSSNSPVIYTY